MHYRNHKLKSLIKFCRPKKQQKKIHIQERNQIEHSHVTIDAYVLTFKCRFSYKIQSLV